jgi:hypothetical protein
VASSGTRSEVRSDAGFCVSFDYGKGCPDRTQNASELETSAYSILPTCSIPRGNANPWKKVWEKLLQWSDFLTNENQTSWCDRTQSSGARRDQLGAGVREANAKIQFGGDFSRIDRSSDIDRTFIRHLVGFSKAAECPLEVTHAKGKKEWKSALRRSCWRGLSSTSQ